MTPRLLFAASLSFVLATGAARSARADVAPPDVCFGQVAGDTCDNAGGNHGAGVCTASTCQRATPPGGCGGVSEAGQGGDSAAGHAGAGEGGAGRAGQPGTSHGGCANQSGGVTTYPCLRCVATGAAGGSSGGMHAGGNGGLSAGGATAAGGQSGGGTAGAGGDDSGCNCRLGPRSDEGSVASLMLLVGFGALYSSRRRARKGAP